jgi:hypothetical protein
MVEKQGQDPQHGHGSGQQSGGQQLANSLKP